MRKKYRQYKEGEQLSLFTQPVVSFRPVRPKQRHCGGVEREVWIFLREAPYSCFLNVIGAMPC